MVEVLVQDSKMHEEDTEIKQNVKEALYNTTVVRYVPLRIGLRIRAKLDGRIEFPEVSIFILYCNIN